MACEVTDADPGRMRGFDNLVGIGLKDTQVTESDAALERFISRGAE